MKMMLFWHRSQQSKGVASARLAKLKMRVCFFLFLNKKFDNVLQIEALSLHRVCIGTMNKINPSFLLLELHQQLRRNGKWLCRWLSGSVPDKEEVWIKDDCSSFTLSPGEEKKKHIFIFWLGLWGGYDNADTDCCLWQFVARFNH